MTNEELQSKTIDFLRFPLIVGVVLIHAHITGMTIKGNDVLRGNSFPVCDTISYFFSEVVARMAVPLFFFISGFLFFRLDLLLMSYYFLNIFFRVLRR